MVAWQFLLKVVIASIDLQALILPLDLDHANLKQSVSINTICIELTELFFLVQATICYILTVTLKAVICKCSLI